MYLSRVTLRSINDSVNESNSEFNPLQQSIYSVHQHLWQLFTDQPRRQFLFRQEIGAAGSPLLYVLSETAPQSHGISNRWEIESKCFQPKIYDGQKLAFSVRINPTICITDPKGKQRRHDVLMHAKHQQRQTQLDDEQKELLVKEAARNWLCNQRRLEQWGIYLDVRPDVESYTQHSSKKKSGQLIQFSTIDYQGILTVTDTNKFLSQYSQGFGRAKAFGCGLMLIKSL
nr:type I-E CRISPR-associated protein Cas6/Cse3/CasE [uncultured Moellerella sp.]